MKVFQTSLFSLSCNLMLCTKFFLFLISLFNKFIFSCSIKEVYFILFFLLKDYFENLNRNIYLFCENVLNKKNGFEAIKSFLNRDIPSIKGKKAGEKIIETENFTDEIPKVINNLNNSYLYNKKKMKLLL